MKVAIYTHKINEPENWKTRKSFYFGDVEKVEISDYNEFRSHLVVIYSKSYPLITYKDGDIFRCRYATEEDVKEYCQITDSKFCFPQVQRNCIEIGKGVWD